MIRYVTYLYGCTKWHSGWVGIEVLICRLVVVNLYKPVQEVKVCFFVSASLSIVTLSLSTIQTLACRIEYVQSCRLCSYDLHLTIKSQDTDIMFRASKYILSLLIDRTEILAYSIICCKKNPCTK